MTLTEKWKAGKLEKCKRYWVKTPVFLGEKPAFLCSDNSFDVDGTIYPNTYDLEVLSPCDYEELQQLRQLLKDCKSTIEIQTKFFAPEFYCCKNDWNGILTRINTAIGESEEINDN